MVDHPNDLSDFPITEDIARRPYYARLHYHNPNLENIADKLGEALLNRGVSKAAMENAMSLDKDETLVVLSVMMDNLNRHDRKAVRLMANRLEEHSQRLAAQADHMESVYRRTHSADVHEKTEDLEVYGDNFHVMISPNEKTSLLKITMQANSLKDIAKNIALALPDISQNGFGKKALQRASQQGTLIK